MFALAKNGHKNEDVKSLLKANFQEVVDLQNTITVSEGIFKTNFRVVVCSQNRKSTKRKHFQKKTFKLFDGLQKADV